MMKTFKILFLFLFLFMGTSTLAFADDDLFFYAGGKLAFVQLYTKDASITNPNLNAKLTNLSGEKPGMGIGLFAGIGTRFNSLIGIRADLDYLYRPPTETNLHTNNPGIRLSSQIYTILTNLYLDFYVADKFQVYVGAGIGVSIFDLQIKAPEQNFPKTGEFSDLVSKADFSWQAGGGFILRLTDDIFTDIQVRYIDFGRYKSTFNGTTGTFSMSAVEVLFGIGYRF